MRCICSSPFLSCSSPFLSFSLASLSLSQNECKNVIRQVCRSLPDIETDSRGGGCYGGKMQDTLVKVLLAVLLDGTCGSKSWPAAEFVVTKKMLRDTREWQSGGSFASIVTILRFAHRCRWAPQLAQDSDAERPRQRTNAVGSWPNYCAFAAKISHVCRSGCRRWVQLTR